MKAVLRNVLLVSALAVATQAAAQVTFYEGDGFRGRAFTVDNVVPNFAPLGFNDRARSAIVDRGRWQVPPRSGDRVGRHATRHGAHRRCSGRSCASHDVAAGQERRHLFEYRSSC